MAEFDFWTSLAFGTPSAALGVTVRYAWGSVLRARSTAAVTADTVPGGQHYKLTFTATSGPHDMRLDTSWTAGVQIVLDDGSVSLVYDIDHLIAAQRQLDGSVGANLTNVLGFPVTVDAGGRLNVSVKSFDGSALAAPGGSNAAGFFNNDGEISGLLLGDLLTLVGRFTGITSVGNWLRAMLRKTAPDATALSEINSGGGTYSGLTDSQEATRDAVNAIEGGSGGGSVPITPTYANAANPRYSTRDLPPIAQASAPIDVISVYDGNGNALNLVGRSLRLVVYEVTDDLKTQPRYDDEIAYRFKYETGGDGLTVGGVDNNEVTVTHDVTKTATAGAFRYFLWDTTVTDGEFVLLKGRFLIEPAVKNIAA